MWLCSNGPPSPRLRRVITGTGRYLSPLICYNIEMEYLSLNPTYFFLAILTIASTNCAKKKHINLRDTPKQPAVNFNPDDDNTPISGNTSGQTQPPNTEAIVADARLSNPSFEDGHTDINDRMQQPNGWTLSWATIGQPLYDTTEQTTGSCECVHLPSSRLPPDEHLGGPDPLILSGDTTYKLFSDQAFANTLSQTLTFPANTTWTISVPIRFHAHTKEPDLSLVETGVWINNQGKWVTGVGRNSREWCKHQATFTTPANGDIKIEIKMQNKKQYQGKDFFIDDILLIQGGDGSSLHRSIRKC